MNQAEALVELGELERFMVALHAQQLLGDHVCCAAQPDTVNGSPEQLVEEGVADGAVITSRWADQVVDAIGDGATELEIRAAIGHAALAFDLQAFATIVEQAILRGLMLGALDSEWERDNDEDLAPAKFAQPTGGPKLVYEPYSRALALFEKKQVLPPAAFKALKDEAKKRAFTVAGLAKQELLDATHAELAKQIREGQAGKGQDTRGVNLRDFRKFAKQRLESAGWTPKSPSHVETIFRTNAVGAYAAGRNAEMTQPKVLAALPLWQILTVRDARQRPTHRDAHGIVLPADHVFWRTAYPPFGFNCFLAGTLIRGAVVGASRARYTGKAIELTTAKGRRLTVTANHPVLTAQGFVPARALRQGMQLLGYGNEPGVAVLDAAAQRNEYETPARVEDVFHALAQAEPIDLARAGAHDFHGEASRLDGEVEVVGAYRQLVQGMPATFTQQLEKLELEAAHATALVDGAAPQLLGADSAPAGRRPGLAALTSNGGRIPFDRGPLLPLRLAAPAQFDSLLTQDASKGLTTDAELFGQLLSRGPSDVAIDEVRSVREFDFAGHVYDLQTVNGWLAADSVVTSNCRCRVVARTKAWLEREAKSIGPVPKNLPDPGFASGTNQIITAPPATLQEPPKPKPKPVAPTTPQLPLFEPPAPPPVVVAPPPPPPPPAPLPPPKLLVEPTGVDLLAKKVADATGSNAGGVYEGSDGVKRYVKFYQDSAQAAGEHLANSLYRDLGFAGPKSELFEHQGKLAYASEILPGVKTIGDRLTKARAAKALEGFSADVLMANWDVAGLGLDNMLVDAKGKIVRIDNGAAFLTRAKGARKPPELLGKVTEWESFFSTAKNPGYAKLASKAGISGPVDLTASIRKGVAKIQKVRAKAGGWRAYVEKRAQGLSVADREQIIGMLEARTSLLQQKLAELEAAALRPKPARSLASLAKGELPTARKSPVAGMTHGDYLEQVDKRLRLLTSTERASITTYTGGDYSRIRDAQFLTPEQWQDKWSKLGQLGPDDYFRYRQIATHIDQSYRKLAAVSGPEAQVTELYRGMRHMSPAQVEQIISAQAFEWQGFTSASWAVKQAENFSQYSDDGKMGIMFVMRTRAETAALRMGIEPVSGIAVEKEILLQRGTRFRITEVQRLDGKRVVVYGEELLPGEAVATIKLTA